MNKLTISLAAASMVLAPVAASAAPALSTVSFGDVRAVSAVDGQSNFDGEGGTTWIVALLALLAIVGGIAMAAGNNDDAPTSP